MWQLADVFRGDWATRKGWGWHSEESWDLFLKTTYDIKQLSKELTAADVLTNDWVAAANDFDAPFRDRATSWLASTPPSP